jgi:hypothetical protein
MSPVNSEIAVIGIELANNSFHVVDPDRRGAIAPEAQNVRNGSKAVMLKTSK